MYFVLAKDVEEKGLLAPAVSAWDNRQAPDAWVQAGQGGERNFRDSEEARKERPLFELLLGDSQPRSRPGT